MKAAPVKQLIKLIPPLLVTLLSLGEVIADEPAVLITTASVGEMLFYPEQSAPATTLSLNNSRISAETVGRIRELPVRVGDQIEKGALLAALTCTDNRLRLRQAEAAVTNARAQLTLADRQIKRTRSLHKDRNISEELFNQREADQKSARANLASSIAAKEEAAVAVNRCNIIAPFSGIILERVASEGEWITAGTPLVRLLDSERLEVSAQIPTDLVESLKKGSGHTLDSSRRQFPLNLRHLLPVVKPRERNREARLTFSGKTALPGSSGRLLWKTATPHLPADLLLQRGNRLGLFLSVDGKARFHSLADALEGQPAAVNLPPSSRLIIEGRQGLMDGDPVQVKN
ncbi:MAG: efflux RND transporter periplasmic adaptor subunit [Candidatus Sedimenticola sp. (ex Thyasira tokunagai)]